MSTADSAQGGMHQLALTRRRKSLHPMGAGDGGQMACQGRTGKRRGMLGQILRHLSLGGRDRATPGEEMLEIAAIGADGIVGQRRIDILAYQSVTAVGQDEADVRRRCPASSLRLLSHHHLLNEL